MRFVEAGWFTAGCGAFRDDVQAGAIPAKYCVSMNPPRRVWLSNFEIARLEVTYAQYASCAHAGACADVPLVAYWDELDRNADPPESTPLPSKFAALVTFANAEAYCRWRGQRLPTEAEWEKAARGQDERIYPWGDDRPTCRRGWIAAVPGLDCEPPEPVGQHPSGRSPYDVEDLAGNAGEWTSTWFNTLGQPAVPDTSFVHVDGVSVLDWSATSFSWPDAPIDPHGAAAPEEGARRIIKGGSRSFGMIGFRETTDREGVEHHPLSSDEPISTNPEISSRSRRDDELASEQTRYLAAAAGFRCARSVAGSAPPTVETPPPGTPALPFREPGFENPAEIARRRLTPGDTARP